MDGFVDPNIETLTNQMARYAPQIKLIFDICGRTASGSFGTVYMATWKNSNRYVAIKHIIPTCKPCRSINEIRCLQMLGGKSNVCSIITTLRFYDNIFIVMPYYEHKKFQTYFQNMTNQDIRLYMKHLLLALKHVHKFGIVHRDVKPSNFIYCSTTKQYVLIDFGLVSASSDMENKILVPNQKYEMPKVEETTNTTNSTKISSQIDNLAKICLHSSFKVCTNCTTKPKKIAMRAGTAGYRAPEILFKYQYQTTSIDVWSAGVIFLSLLTGCYPFFKSSSDMGHLVQITTLLGSTAIRNSARDANTRFTCSPDFEPNDLRKLCLDLRRHKCAEYNSSCENCISPSAYELLERCLDPNHKTRVTADQALSFDYVKNTN